MMFSIKSHVSQVGLRDHRVVIVARVVVPAIIVRERSINRRHVYTYSRQHLYRIHVPILHGVGDKVLARADDLRVLRVLAILNAVEEVLQSKEPN